MTRHCMYGCLLTFGGKAKAATTIARAGLLLHLLFFQWTNQTGLGLGLQLVVLAAICYDHHATCTGALDIPGPGQTSASEINVWGS
jgi:hypothetical protein